MGQNWRVATVVCWSNCLDFKAILLGWFTKILVVNGVGLFDHVFLKRFVREKQIL